MYLRNVDNTADIHMNHREILEPAIVRITSRFFWTPAGAEYRRKIQWKILLKSSQLYLLFLSVILKKSKKSNIVKR
jgi:hypothetical protein